MTRLIPDEPMNSAVEEDKTDVENRRAGGEFVRGVSAFRNQLGEPLFPPEPNRYHLYVALNCPWCHRVTLARNVLGLQNAVSLNVVFPNRTDEDDPAGPNHWFFDPSRVASLTGEALPECTTETATGQSYRLVGQIYGAESSNECSLPILYDKKSTRIVSNESAEIIRMLDAQANHLGSALPSGQRLKLFPDGEQNAALRNDIEDLNQLIYGAINNGAYKAGFSSSQEIYSEAFSSYFSSLDLLESRLASDGREYLTGSNFTEADLRLFPTLYRHDPVYYVRMKLNGARILDYPNLWRWLCRVYALPGVAESSSLIHCRQGYFGRTWNRVVPMGPIRPMTYPTAYEHPELAQ